MTSTVTNTPTKSTPAMTENVLALLAQLGLVEGAHLSAQVLANFLKVSRTPVNEALAHLENQGLVTRQKNRGYFLHQALPALPSIVPHVRLENSIQTQAEQGVYFKIAEDRLLGLLPDQISQAQLQSRYRLTPSQMQSVLSRIAQEGWITKKPGYGWEFSNMLTTPDSLLQSYRLRLALEPAALLEPGYQMKSAVIERCRAAELHLLSGGIDSASADELHARGVYFHESLVEASGNAFFIDTIARVNRVRRLLSYRSMQDRTRYRLHCEQHLQILDAIEQGNLARASELLEQHLQETLKNLAQIFH